MKKYPAIAALCLALGSLGTYAFTGYALWAPLTGVPGEVMFRLFLLTALHVAAIVGGAVVLIDAMEEQKK